MKTPIIIQRKEDKELFIHLGKGLYRNLSSHKKGYGEETALESFSQEHFDFIYTDTLDNLNTEIPPQKTKKQKEKIWTSVQLNINNITLTVDTDHKLNPRLDSLKNSGHIEINEGDIFWDNLPFFIPIKFKEFKKECGEELHSLGLNKRKTFKTIKQLIKKAIKLKILNK